MQAETSAARPHLSAAFLATQDDPYPAYAELRGRGPMHRAELGQWLVTHHTAVSTLLRDNRLVSQMPPEYLRLTLGDGPGVDFLQRIVLTRTPPDHTQLRRFIGRALGTPVVRRLGEQIGAAADALIAPALDRGRIDIVTELAVPLPVGVVCDLIGIPTEDRAEVLTRVIALAKVFDAANLTAADLRDINTALPWLHGYLGDLLSRRQADPGGPTLAGMYWEEADGQRLSVDDFIDNMLFLFHAGVRDHDGPGLQRLRRVAGPARAVGPAPRRSWPDSLRGRGVPALRRTDPERHPGGPGAGRVRRPEDPHRAYRVLLGAANRDERVFADPERLDVGRNPNPHLGFGGGLHHCLGTALARLMSVVVFERLVNRVEILGPAGPRVRRQHASLRSYDELPMAIRSR